jgi:hypothetical protein
MPYCAKCRQRWTSTRTAHCAGCCRTFRSVGGFDKHRRDFQCVDPSDLGMEMDNRGFWFTPMSEEYLKRLKTG